VLTAVLVLSSSCQAIIDIGPLAIMYPPFQAFWQRRASDDLHEATRKASGNPYLGRKTIGSFRSQGKPLG
jgi:hypothetical protein